MTGRHPWRAYAACASVGPDPFFPDTTTASRGDGYRVARRICDQCPVWRECRMVGMTEQYGLWGGMNAKERQAARNVGGLIPEGVSGNDSMGAARNRVAAAMDRHGDDVDGALTEFPALAAQPLMYEYETRQVVRW